MSPASLAAPARLANSGVAETAEALNDILANGLTLYLKTKNFHWHVSGPHFRDYHLLLDEQAAQILLATDAVAERVRKTGHETVRSIGEISRRQTIADNDMASVAAVDMLGELIADNIVLVEQLKAAKLLADAARDNATSAVIDTWTDEAETRAWMLREAVRAA